MKIVIVGIALAIPSVALAQAPSKSFEAISSAIDDKYAKKYDSWEALGVDESKVNGTMANNCTRLEAKWCKRLETSIINVEPPSSRPEKIIVRAKKACESIGGSFRSQSLSRNTSGLAESSDVIQRLVFEKVELIPRRDYIATRYYGVCSRDGQQEALIVTSGIGKKALNSDGSKSYGAFVAKGNTFIYMIDIAAEKTRFDSLESQQTNADNAFEDCMALPLAPGFEVITRGKKGLVVEVKGPLVQVQTNDALSWVKSEDVKRDISDCRKYVKVKYSK